MPGNISFDNCRKTCCCCPTCTSEERSWCIRPPRLGSRICQRRTAGLHDSEPCWGSNVGLWRLAKRGQNLASSYCWDIQQQIPLHLQSVSSSCMSW